MRFVLLRSEKHILCSHFPVSSVDKDAAAAMSDSGANFEVERYSNSSASSSETSLSQANDIRGRRTERVFKTIKEALMVPVRVSLAIARAEFEPSMCTGTRKAVCIGINYRHSSQAAKDHYGRLFGCIKDTHNIQKYLIEHEGFNEADIRLMTDRTATPDDQKPTKENILAAMKWLAEGAKKNDTLFFHFSGHGDQVEDQDEDEVDRLDEALVPCDYNEDADLIKDDDIYKKLVELLPKGCRLTAVVDCCTSGTAFDLPCAYRAPLLPRLPSEEQVVHEYQPYTRRFPLSTCADVVYWSGCKDSHRAADTPTMTMAFIETMTASKRKGESITYDQVLRSMRDKVYAEPIGKERQKPQFGSAYPINMKTPFFITSSKV
ncbi:uncharacterized protein SCHCODRAFT_02607692 [Schizophyllum commune H4-8]|nr:uncharacterized protein SCHCODRAFT_02607692 [Schizophyllum commune H4-8]KAI5900357.1 hypothetical protein SCHCODRAFT_02607692 [Schizophyllum commune H4-8]